MCIHLFNPPSPDCQPTSSAGPGFPGYGLCGRCSCIPKHFRIDVQQVFTGVGGVDDLMSNLAGTWILTRRIAKYPSFLFQKCVFLSRPLDTSSFYTHEEGAAPGDVDIDVPLSPLSLWALVWDRFSPEGTAVSEWYTSRWALFAGAYWWNELDLGPTPSGGGGATTGDRVGTYDACGFLQPDDFRCMEPNDFYAVEGVFQSSFKPTITVTPFWP